MKKVEDKECGLTTYYDDEGKLQRFTIDTHYAQYMYNANGEYKGHADFFPVFDPTQIYVGINLLKKPMQELSEEDFGWLVKATTDEMARRIQLV